MNFHNLELNTILCPSLLIPMEVIMFAASSRPQPHRRGPINPAGIPPGKADFDQLKPREMD